MSACPAPCPRTPLSLALGVGVRAPATNANLAMKVKHLLSLPSYDTTLFAEKSFGSHLENTQNRAQEKSALFHILT